jgi:hypothetical protein
MNLLTLILLCILFPITKLERTFGSQIQVKNSTDCSKTIFASHRGFSNLNKFIDSSHQSIKEAINQNIKHIEIDVTLVPGQIFLRHDDFLEKNISTKYIEKNYPELMTLQEFINIYSKSFETVLVDIKRLNQSHDDAFNLFSNLRGAENFYFIGQSCRLLRRIQKELGWKAGCESQGITANWILGMHLWSTNIYFTTSFQFWLNKFFKLKSIFWTFDTSTRAKKYCVYQPDIVLIDLMNK